MFLCLHMIKKIRPVFPYARYIQTQLTKEEVEALQQRFPEPLKYFKNLLQEACFALQNVEASHYKIQHNSLKYVQNGVAGTVWHTNLEVFWPEHFTVEGIGSSKTEATRISYLQACKRILDLGGPSRLPLRDSNSNATTLLCESLAIVAQDLKQPGLAPNFHIERVPEVEGWRCHLRLAWPQELEFFSLGPRKNVVKDIAAQQALEHLQKLKVLNKNFKPILVTPEQMSQYFREKNGPLPVSLKPSLKQDLADLVGRFKRLRSELPPLPEEAAPSEPQDEPVPLDIMTGKPYEEEHRSSNADLYNLFHHRQTSPHPQVAWMKKMRQALPIFDKKEEILKTIDQNPVVLIHGQTGCGKTMQVPQYLLERASLAGRGSEVNIVVTQPRRISALSIAASVAHELGEPLGCTVGYQIRLDKVLPSRARGAILFCSTGILLRYLQANHGRLPGITHIIVDEAHERDIQMDLLLTLLRQKISQDSKLRLILMSASFDLKLFSAYFNNCPAVNVPGMTFPVKEHYLPEILQELGDDPGSYAESQVFSEKVGQLICRVVQHIDRSRPKGKAILVFFPGWQEIKWVYDQLSGNPELLLLPTHSRLSPAEQMAIFHPAPHGMRKVVLATNIAESSVTVEDVGYVVDSGLHKESYLHGSAPTLRTCWAAQANVIQRRGRAGRVAPGEAFHLFSRSTLDAMEIHPCPEILRVPLEGTILEAKAFFPENQSVKDLLATTPQPPTSRAISQALEELQTLDLITEDEKLTRLGKMAAWLPTNDPRLAKALLLSLFFKCLDPVLTAVSVLTVLKDLFLTEISNREDVKEAKGKLSTTPHSDHLTWVKVQQLWKKHPDPELFCQQHLLNDASLHFVEGLRGMYRELMTKAGYLDGTETAEEDQDSLTVATLTAAFFPNIFRVQQGVIRSHRYIPSVTLLTSLRGEHGQLSKDSVVAQSIKDQRWRLLTYHSGLNSLERQSLVVRDATAVPINLAAALGGPWNTAADSQGNVELRSTNYPNLHISCTQKEADLLAGLSECYSHTLDRFLRSLPHSTDSPEDQWYQLRTQLVKCLAKLATPDTDVPET